MPKPRISGLRLCRTIGCEGFTETGSSFCDVCNEGRRQRPPPRHVRPGERDVDIVLLRERMAGQGRFLERVRAEGTHPCLVCEGPTLPGRVCCSDICRRRARTISIEVDGVVASIESHRRRLGVSKSLFYHRIGKGASVEEALTRPMDEEMQRRGRCRGT